MRKELGGCANADFGLRSAKFEVRLWNLKPEAWDLKLETLDLSRRFVGLLQRKASVGSQFEKARWDRHSCPAVRDPVKRDLSKCQTRMSDLPNWDITALWGSVSVCAVRTYVLTETSVVSGGNSWHHVQTSCLTYQTETLQRFGVVVSFG